MASSLRVFSTLRRFHKSCLAGFCLFFGVYFGLRYTVHVQIANKPAQVLPVVEFKDTAVAGTYKVASDGIQLPKNISATITVENGTKKHSSSLYVCPKANYTYPSDISGFPVLSISSKHLLKHKEDTTYAELFEKNYHSFSDLPRRMSLQKHQEMLKILKRFVNILDDLEIEYVMLYGTLLGSYMFHDLTPWDDDADICIAFRHINQLRHFFASKEFPSEFGVSSWHDPYNTYHSDNLQCDVDLLHPFKCVGNIPSKLAHKAKSLKCLYKGKIFLKSSPYKFKIKGLPWRFPFIDFSFYLPENERNLVMVDRNKRPIDFVDFYPFHLRPYHDMWLPAPHNAHKYLKRKLNTFHCAHAKWEHAKESPVLPKVLKSCETIKNWYPYVIRQPVQKSSGNVTREVLMLGEQVLREVDVDELFVNGSKALTL